MQQDVRIELATEDERDRAFAINQEYLETFDIVVRETVDSFRMYFEDGAGFWLAWHRDEVIGCIGLRPLAQVGCHHGRGACEVKRLYVRPRYRGQQVADRLLDDLEQFAVAAGYHEAYLDTKDDLDAALRFYTRRGYTRCERYNDNPQATIFMHRTLCTSENGIPIDDKKV